MDDDDLIDLQIEESLSRETLMSIDTSNVYEVFLIALLFSFLSLIIIFIGFYSPPKETAKQYFSYFNNNDTASIYRFGNISSWNRYVFASLSFTIQKFAADSKIENISFLTYVNETINSKSIYLIKPEIYTENLSVKAQAETTEPIQILYDSFPDYNEIVIVVKLLNQHNSSPITGTSIYLEYGNSKQPLFQIITRYTFMVFCCIAFFFLCYRLCQVSFGNWHLEQKLTFILIIACLFADDPFYILQFYFPSSLLSFSALLFQSFFYCYLRFFIYTLFSSLSYKNRKIPMGFFTFRIILMVFDFVVDLFYSLITSNELSNSYLPFENTAQVENTAIFMKNSVFILYGLLIFICLIKTAFKIDVTEKFKYRIYLFSSLLCLIPLIIVNVLDELEIMNDTSLCFLTTFALQNFYVLIMTISHYPYEIINDQEYLNADYDNKSLDNFFVNETY